jgi:hypothetical protein
LEGVTNQEIEDKMTYSKLLSISAALVAGCAGVSPTALTPITGGSVVALRTPVQYSEYYRVAGNRFHYTIGAGQYVAKYKDADGTYFEGPSGCFTVQVESDGKPPYAPNSYRCGLYIPSNTSIDPKLYFYKDAAASQAVLGGTTVQVVDRKGQAVYSPTAAAGAATGMGIVRALDAAELKNLHFHHDQPKPGQLRQSLQQ